MISNNEIEKAAIYLVRQEKNSWQESVAFITDKVAFNMRNLIRLLRKNFWGIFDVPNDPQTGRPKIWIPLTEWMVDTTVKNIDLDTKDINFRAKNSGATKLTKIVRQLVKNALDKMFFGQKLDDLERQLAIDGTAVWKTIEWHNPESKRKEPKILNVDLLNIYIDPTTPSIQEAYRFTERGLMTATEVMSMDGWMNTDGVTGTIGLARTDEMLMGYKTSTAGGNSGTKMVDVWETWGLIPKWLITGNEKDQETKEEIEGHIIVSSIDTPGKEKLHVLESNESGFKPYEEAWLTRVPGRWYGKGVCEKVMWLQMWINTIVNIRINRSYVSQLGIFKIKKGSGVTPQMLSRLSANGAVVLNNMEDMEQFQMSEASQASYNDEQNAVSWAQRTTNSFDVATGESMPSSTPATNAAITNISSQSYFTVIKEGLGMFLDRWITRHYLPKVLKNTRINDIIRTSGDIQDIKELDEVIVNNMIYAELENANSMQLVIDPMQVEFEKQRALKELENSGTDRFIKLLDKLNITDFDVSIDITNEKIDKNVLYQNLVAILQVVPEYKDQIVEKMFDLMGLDFNKNQALPPASSMQPGVMQAVDQQSAPQSQSAPSSIINALTK